MKKLLSIIVAITMVMSSVVVAFAGEAKIAIDGEPVQYTTASGAPFVDAASRTQVPFRQTLETLGATVKWDASNNIAVAKEYGITVKVPIGANYIYKDGVKIQNDTAALLKDGHTYLPIRSVLEAFGYNVGWEQETNTVTVSDDVDTINQDINQDLPMMEIHFIDVGQGDCALIDYGEYEILIDAGYNNYGKFVVDYIKPYIDGDLEYIIATHPDADHVGGLDDVLSAYAVDNIIDSGCCKETATYKAYYAAVSAEPNCNLIYDSDMTIDMGAGAALQIIETGDNHSEVNNNSVVSLLKYNNISALFTGDMETQAEIESLTKFSDVDVLKAGHHGSKTSSSAEFLNVVRPEYVIVSAALNSPCGHPHLAALQRFFDARAIVYGTFKSGTIVMSTDGNTYSFNTNFALTTMDAGRTMTSPSITVPTTTPQEAPAPISQ